MQMSIINLVYANLSNHDVIWTKRELQIVDEDSFDDKHAYFYQILFYLDRIRVD
jgi:hypothetical protein